MADDALRANLRRLLAESERSARSVSQEAGLSESAVKHILRNPNQSPRYENVEAIARVFGLTAAQLTGSDPGLTPSVVKLPKQIVEDQAELRLLRYWKHLNAEGKRVFLHQIGNSPLTE